MVLWTPVSQWILCTGYGEGIVHIFKAIQCLPHKKSTFFSKSKQTNTWKQPQNDHGTLHSVLLSFFSNKVAVLADKFNSSYIWIQDINKVIMVRTENAFNGCLGILRGRQIKGGKQAQEGGISEPALALLFLWMKLSSERTFAGWAGACITQVALQQGSWLPVKSGAHRPVEV